MKALFTDTYDAEQQAYRLTCTRCGYSFTNHPGLTPVPGQVLGLVIQHIARKHPFHWWLLQHFPRRHFPYRQRLVERVGE